MPENKIRIVHNVKPYIEPEEEKINAIKDTLGIKNKFVVVYIGTLEDKRFIKELVEVSKETKEIIFVIGGLGKYENFVKKNQSANLKYLGFLHPKDVGPYLKCANLCVCIYHPSAENQNIELVSKFFDCINFSVPMIVNRELRETAKIVKTYNCGIVIPYGKKEFVSAIMDLKDDPEAQNMMRNNIAKLKEKYNWERESKKLLQLYNGGV